MLRPADRIGGEVALRLLCLFNSAHSFNFACSKIFIERAVGR